MRFLKHAAVVAVVMAASSLITGRAGSDPSGAENKKPASRHRLAGFVR